MTPLEHARRHAERAEAAYASTRSEGVFNQGLYGARLSVERDMASMWAQVALAEAPSVDATVLAGDLGYPGSPEPDRQPEKSQETHCDEHKAAYFDSGYQAGLKDALDPSLRHLPKPVAGDKGGDHATRV